MICPPPPTHTLSRIVRDAFIQKDYIWIIFCTREESERSNKIKPWDNSEIADTLEILLNEIFIDKQKIN